MKNAVLKKDGVLFFMEAKWHLKFLPQIDGLRFVAVLGVMLHHWQAPFNSYILGNIPFGTGVNLFFVISGFLITLILLHKKQEIEENKTTFGREIKNFYAKRTLRIFPIYYLLIGILCLVYYDCIKDYLVYMLTYTINWFMVLHDRFLWHETHFWSLAVEEQFYLVWPFLIFFVPRRFTLPLIITAILGSLASKIYFYNSIHKMGVNGATFSCFDSLGLGALIAYIQMRRKGDFNPRPYRFFLIVSIFLYVVLFINPPLLCPQDREWLFNFGTSVVYFFVVMLAANGGFSGLVKDFLENKTVLYLGKISYGLYLYHGFLAPIYNAYVSKWLPRLTGDFDRFVIFFLITVIFATLSWYLIEKPLLGLKRKFQ